MKLIKPRKLQKGDTVATVSLSNGCAGDKELIWRYQVGKKRIIQELGLNVIEMAHTLSGSDYLYEHPEKRAEDLMNAFKDPDIKGIFTCIGGCESIRMLPYIDFDVIHSNPKIFMGYSDSTITHFMCLKSKVASFYGASVLCEFAENIKMYDYTLEWVKKTLFTDQIIGTLYPAQQWTGEYLEWTLENAGKSKTMQKNQEYELLQGEGKGLVTGHLIGGCLEVMEMIKGTTLWPEDSVFNGAILFFETSEDTPPPNFVEYWLRNYGTKGILQRINGILWGKPYQEKYYEEYKHAILKVMHEFHVEIPILYNITIGHNEPMLCIPYGSHAQINCQSRSVRILDSSVI